MTPELEAEGLVRDLARSINDLRRHEGFDVSDRIRLLVHVGHHADVRDAIEANRDLLTSAVLAGELLFVDEKTNCGHRVELADGRAVHIGLSRV